ncbi:hypothetical protein K443DRAFT_686904 [Laccaria amethystina LaAM-08-1]|uniref:Uncharacterized protein n=1 Tax=Laccaria amethystina LaAM-08-1 TaxID=1095629 RepID=A0A0C9WLC8_9AGAR|nr:hypothetical protein K443DRAFT_686904 [Laccaria amethystina LaAM-08-1]
MRKSQTGVNTTGNHFLPYTSLFLIFTLSGKFKATKRTRTLQTEKKRKSIHIYPLG